MHKYSLFEHIKRIYRKACVSAGFLRVMLRIEHLAHEFLHYRIFLIRITRLSEKRMYNCINIQTIGLEWNDLSLLPFLYGTINGKIYLVSFLFFTIRVR